MISVGRFQNDVAAPIILLEADDLGSGIVIFKLEDVGHIGASPRIDRLVWVADCKDIVVLMREQPD